SALYTRPLEGGGQAAFTFAWARKDTSDNLTLDAWLAEGAWTMNPEWTTFARIEAVETDELVHPGPVEDVAKISIGLVRDFEVARTLTLGLGGLIFKHWGSAALDPLYDGDPMGAMALVRLKVS